MEDKVLVLIVFYWLIILTLWIGGVCCSGFYAERLGRSSGGFALLALFFSPILSAFFLFMLGETNEHRKARIIEEEKWRHSCDADTKQEVLTQKENAQEENIMDVLS